MGVFWCMVLRFVASFWCVVVLYFGVGGLGFVSVGGASVWPILVHGAPFCGFVLVRGGPLFWCLVWALVRYGAAFCGSLSALFWSPFCVEAPI